MDEEITRRCTVCKAILPLSAFVKAKTKKYGRGYRCKACAAKYNQEHKENIILPPTDIQMAWDFSFRSKNCQVCGKVFAIHCERQYEERLLCSRKCDGVRRGRMFAGENNPNYKHGNIKNCDVCGRPYCNQGRTLGRKYCSLKCARTKRVGKDSPAWKGGISFINQALRGSNIYKDWRLSVIERDGSICNLCSKYTDRPQAHHIKQFVRFPHLRLVVSNGITLCEPCHCKIKGKEQKYEAFFERIQQKV